MSTGRGERGGHDRYMGDVDDDQCVAFPADRANLCGPSSGGGGSSVVGYLDGEG